METSSAAVGRCVCSAHTGKSCMCVFSQSTSGRPAWVNDAEKAAGGWFRKVRSLLAVVAWQLSKPRKPVTAVGFVQTSRASGEE